MRLLELFSGSGSIGNVFKRSYEVTSLDSDPKARATITCDIMDWDYKVYEPGYFDVIWASPPCTEFSVLKTSGTRDFAKADGIVRRTLAIIDYSRPRLFFCENPQTGLLKTRPYMQGLPSVTLDYCKYGTPYRKRTQVWTNCSYWTPRPLCRCDCGHIHHSRNEDARVRKATGQNEDAPNYSARARGGNLRSVYSTSGCRFLGQLKPFFLRCTRFRRRLGKNSLPQPRG